MVYASSSSRVCVVMLALFLGGCGSGPGAGGGGGAGGTGGQAGRGGAGSGGMAGVPCTATSCASFEYCSTCGPRAGTCQGRPQDCIYQGSQIVCGCDGKLYMNSCEAEGAGTDIAPNGDACVMPPGTFRCGTKFCTHGTQYCEVWSTNDPAPGVPGPYVYGYACEELAAGCDATTPTCACVTRTECGGCIASADGDLTAMCRPASG